MRTWSSDLPSAYTWRRRPSKSGSSRAIPAKTIRRFLNHDGVAFHSDRRFIPAWSGKPKTHEVLHTRTRISRTSIIAVDIDFGSTVCKAFAATAWARLLHRRAPVGAIGAVHAAVPGFRPEYRFAMLAFVKPRTGVGGHRLVFPMSARRTRDGRIQHDGTHHRTCMT
jgi:hypothetical protein